MNVAGRLAPCAAVVLAGACLSPVQVRAQVRIDGQLIPMQVLGVEPVGGTDPWWIQGDAEEAVEVPQGDAQPQARVQAQLRLAQARRTRAEATLVRELSRLREACPTLEPDDRAAILAAGRKLVEDQAAGRAPLGTGMETVLERAVEQAAGPEAAVVYAEEVASRVARQKATAIAVIVEAVDRDAQLDDDQRRAVAARLAERWRPEWAAVAATALRQRITFARLPQGVPDVVALALDPETVAAWRARAVEALR